MNVATTFILSEANILEYFKNSLVKALESTTGGLKWARMSIQASKSKTLVLTNGKCDQDAKHFISTNQLRDLFLTNLLIQ